MTLLPASLGFVLAGEPKGVTLTNGAAAPLGITSIKLTGSFAEVDNCGTSLAAGASCQIFVTPTVTNTSVSGTLTVVSSDTQDAQTVSLSGSTFTTPYRATISSAQTYLPIATFGGEVPSGSGGGYNFSTNTVSVNAPFLGGSCSTKAPVPSTPPGCSVEVDVLPTQGYQGFNESLITSNGGFSAAAVANVVLAPHRFYAGYPSLVFTPVKVGVPASQTITVQNMSTAAISISSATLSTGALNTGDFTIQNSCGGLAASATYMNVTVLTSCTITVKFVPSTTGLRQSLLTITEASGYTSTVLLSGNGAAAGPTVSNVAFGNAPLNTMLTQTVTVGVPSGDYVSASLATGSVFQLSSTGCTPVNNVCQFTLMFTPTALTTYTDTLTVKDLLQNTTATATVTGTGGVPVVSFSPTTLTFPAQAANTTSSVMPLTLTNTGNAPLVINYLQFAGVPYFNETTNCPTTLAAGASCVYSVVFKPGNAGSYSGAVDVSSNATNPHNPVALVGTGTGTPAVYVQAGSTYPYNTLTFPAQTVGTTSASQSIQIANNGSALGTFSLIALSGSGSSDFTLVNSCPATLAPGSLCYVTVNYHPSQPGSSTVFLNALFAESSTAGTVTINATGVGGLTLSPAKLAFGSVALGTTSTLTSTLTNGATTAATISATSAGDYFASSNNCGTSLAAGASCLFSVTFTSGGSGVQAGSTTVATNLPGSLVQLTYTGTVVPAVLTLSPTSVSFPTQAAGTTSAGISATLTNNGSTATTINGAQLVGNNPSSFSFSSGCGATLAAGASCSYAVYFTPVAAGALFSASLVVTTSAGTVALPVSGASAAVSAGPVLTFAPGMLVFPAQLTGTSSVMTATVTNTSGSPVALAFDSLATGGNGGGTVPLSYSGSCPNPLAAGASCTFTVTFAPTVAGSFKNGLLIGTSTQGLFQLPISATATVPVANGPVLTFVPGSLVFAPQLTGTSSVMTATATNTSGGPVALAFDSLATGGNGGGTVPLSYTGSCPTPLAAGASCTFTVTFAPTVAGSFTNRLLIGTATQGLFQLPISATATAPVANGPVLTFTPGSLAFPAQAVGASAVMSATVTNTSGSPVALAFDSLGTGGNGGGSVPFSYTGTCPTPLAAGASCTFNVTFAPNSTGPASNTLLIGTATQGLFQLPISGTGVAGAPAGPALVFLPGSLVFPAQAVGTSSTLTATVTNTTSGPVTLNYDSLATGGNGGGTVPFRYTGTCPTPLAAGASCTFNVTFAPGTTGDASDMLLIGTAVGTFSLQLTGTGTVATGKPVLQFSPSPLAFGAQAIGTSVTKAVTLTNTGGTPATFSFDSLGTGGTSAAGFSYTSSCGATLAPGAACTFLVTFAPMNGMTFSNTLIVGTTNPSQQVYVALTGSGS